MTIGPAAAAGVWKFNVPKLFVVPEPPVKV
jgi:hypothetical protein